MQVGGQGQQKLAFRFPWTAAERRRRVALAISLLPAQWLLLRVGNGMDRQDMVGVVLTIAQWWLLNAAFAARPATP